MYDGSAKNMKQCYYNSSSTKDIFKNGNNIIPNENKTITFDLKEFELWKINLRI